jgi:HK97 family phage major capsid protein
MNLKMLRQKKADLIAEAQTIFDLSAAENRGLSDQEKARDDEIGAALKGLDDDIVRAESQADRQRQLSAMSGGLGQFRDAVQPAQSQSPTGFESFGEMLTAVARAGQPGGRAVFDDRLIMGAATGANESVSADGGYLVDTQLVGDLLTNVWTSGDVLSRVTRQPIGPGKNGIKMLGIDETSRVNGSRYGGIQAYWTGEAQQIQASQPKFKKIGAELEKLTGMCYATQELLEDSTALQGWINRAFPLEMEFKLEDAVFNGTGVGMPLGWYNSPSLLTISKEAGQPNGTILPENIVKMWARMPARNRKGAVWFVNQDIEPQLLLMNMKVKNVAGTENVGGLAIPTVVYTPPGTASDGFGRLMGLPVVPVEYASTLGQAGDIMLCDASQYMVIDKGGIKQDVSIHVRFLFDETAFRFTYRVNGQPLWTVPMTPYKGTATQSPFVILQTR